jgi:hypothetical protein
MIDARASAPWETIRSGLRLLAMAWVAQIGFTVLNRILWTLIFSALSSSSANVSLLIKALGTIAFLGEVGFTVIGVALAVAAARLTRFPLVERAVTPADPYRGARDAGPARDPGLDGPALVVVAALTATVGLGLVSYVYNTWLAPDYVPGPHPLGLREGIRAMTAAGPLVAGAMFTIWAARAARVASRPLSPALPIASFLSLAAFAAFESWDIVTRVWGGYPSWTHWAGLALDCASTGVLIAVALGTMAALRDQPRSPGE